MTPRGLLIACDRVSTRIYYEMRIVRWRCGVMHRRYLPSSYLNTQLVGLAGLGLVAETNVLVCHRIQ